jgi:hypothetical protein
MPQLTDDQMRQIAEKIADRVVPVHLAAAKAANGGGGAAAAGAASPAGGAGGAPPAAPGTSSAVASGGAAGGASPAAPGTSAPVTASPAGGAGGAPPAAPGTSAPVTASPAGGAAGATKAQPSFKVGGHRAQAPAPQQQLAEPRKQAWVRAEPAGRKQEIKKEAAPAASAPGIKNVKENAAPAPGTKHIKDEERIDKEIKKISDDEVKNIRDKEKILDLEIKNILEKEKISEIEMKTILASGKVSDNEIKNILEEEKITAAEIKNILEKEEILDLDIKKILEKETISAAEIKKVRDNPSANEIKKINKVAEENASDLSQIKNEAPATKPKVEAAKMASTQAIKASGPPAQAQQTTKAAGHSTPARQAAASQEGAPAASPAKKATKSTADLFDARASLPDQIDSLLVLCLSDVASLDRRANVLDAFRQAASAAKSYVDGLSSTASRLESQAKSNLKIQQKLDELQAQLQDVKDELRGRDAEGKSKATGKAPKIDDLVKKANSLARKISDTHEAAMEQMESGGAACHKAAQASTKLLATARTKAVSNRKKWRLEGLQAASATLSNAASLGASLAEDPTGTVASASISSIAGFVAEQIAVLSTSAKDRLQKGLADTGEGSWAAPRKQQQQTAAPGTAQPRKTQPQPQQAPAAPSPGRRT